MTRRQRLPWFKCNPSKLLGAIAGLDEHEGFVYVVVLMRIYETGGPISDTAKVIARRTGKAEKHVSAALQSLADMGKIELQDGQIDAKSTHETLEEMEGSHERASGAAKTAAQKRWEKTKENQQNGDAVAMRSLCDRVQIETQKKREMKKDRALDSDPALPFENESSSTNSASDDAGEFPNAVNPAVPEAPSRFEQFWTVYPMKKGKEAARKAFKRVALSKKVTFDDLMLGLERYKLNIGDTPYCHPTTWLNQGRWADEYGNVEPIKPKAYTGYFEDLSEEERRLAGLRG